MKFLLFLFTLIPMIGIAQPGKMRYESPEVNPIELSGINEWNTELQLLGGENIFNPRASAFLNTVDEHKTLLDSTCNFHFRSAIDSSLTSRTINKYDANGNLVLQSFNYLRSPPPGESYKNEYILDENGNCKIRRYFTWDYEAKQWIKRDVYENTYDIEGRLIKIMSARWNKDGAELIPSKTEKKYDAHGNLLLEVESRYNALIDQWVDYFQKEYGYKNDKCTLQIISSQWSEEPIPLMFDVKGEWEYDDNGNLLSNVVSTWDKSSNKWTNSGKDTYTYNSNYKVTNHTNLFWESNHWQDSQKTDYSYDANGHKILEVISQWDSYNWVPGQWIPYRQTEYTPDINGNEGVRVVSNWDKMTNKWMTNYKYEKIYNDKNLLHSELFYILHSIDSVWHPVVKEDYRYNYDGNTTMTAKSLWQEDSKEWWSADKNYLYYSLHDLTNALEQPEHHKVKLYPNPAREVLMLEINDPAIIYCQLIDSNGLMVHSMPLEPGVNIINISNLRQGMYLVKMKAGKGTIVKKLIKN